MATADKLWFELGVRDEISGVLEKLMRNSDKLAQMLTNDATELKNVYKNILDISNVYDKIYITQKRISEARNSKSLTADEKKGLEDMSKELENMRKEFAAILKDPDRAITKGEAQFEKMRLNIELMLKDTLRYVDHIEAKEAAEAKNAANESKRIDDLKAKYYDLQRYRKQLSDAIVGAAPGVSLGGKTKNLSQSLDYRMNQVFNALHNGGAMPNSAKGADFEKFLQEVKAKITELTGATSDYNSRLEANRQLQSTLNKLNADTISQQKIADIRGQKVEYTALGQKIQEVTALLNAVQKEQADLFSGKITAPIWTQEKVTEELNAIQRRYNETLAAGRQRELDDAKAKREKSEAARQAAKSMQDLASAYDRVTTSAKRTNSILDQVKAQIASTISLYAGEHFLKSIIEVGGEFEQQHIALQAILGDVQQANSMFEQMKELAVVSPFNFRQLAGYSKQVAAFGIPYEEMYDTTKRLADMSAGLGVDMGRLILAYGQVRSAAVLRGQELRQFTEAGIPMVKALAQEFSKLNGKAVSTAEVFELISKRAVSFEMVKKVLWDMTNEGGRFYDMQFTLSDTLLGKWSNLQDAWEIMLSEMSRGESIGGKMLKLFVSLTTSLIENMNTLMPLITGLAITYPAVKVAKIVNNARQVGYVGINKNIESAQRLRAVELARQKINGEIDRSKYSQLMKENLSKGNYYKMLALEGKLNALQIQRAYRQGYINKQELAYLVQLRLITNEQRKQILLNKLNEGAMGRMSFAAKGFFRSINAWMGPIGWIMLAVDVIGTGLITWWNNIKEIEKKNQELADGFSNHSKELKESISSMANAPKTDDEYKSAIGGMKELLKQHSGNYEAIMLEVSGVESLQEQYELLKKELSSLKDVYDKAEATAPDFADATRSQFEDVKEWARELSKNKGAGRLEFSFDLDELQFRRNEDIFIDRVKKLADKIKEEIPNVGTDKIANSLYRQLRNSLEQELGFGSREKMFVDIKLNELLHIKDDNAIADIVAEKFSSAIDLAEPRIANKLKYGKGKKLEEAEQAKITQLINNAIKETEKQYPIFEKRLQELLNNSDFSALIKLKYSTSGNVNDLQKFVYGNFIPSLSENIKNTATNWANGGSMYEARNNAKKDIDAVYNEKLSRQSVLDKLKKDRKSDAKQIDDAQKLVDETNIRYNNLITAASIGLGYDYEGEKKKSNKNPNGNKKDDELEKLKNRVDLYKKFYSELENATKIYGSGALDYLKDNGFAEVFGWNLGDVTNYRQSLDELTKGFVLNTEARRKFANSVDADKVSNQRKADADAISKINSELKTQLSMLGEQYDTYKRIYQLTGNKEGAMNLAFGGSIQSATYKDELIRRMREALAAKPQGTMTAEDVFAMDKNTFAKTFGENSKIFSELYGAYAANEKKIKQETLQLLEETVSKNRTLAQQIDDENRRYERQLELIKQINDPTLRQQAEAGATQEHNEKIAHYQFEQFKANSNWVKIFDDLDRVTTETLRDLMDATERFGRTAGLSVEDVKALQDAIAKMRNELANRNPFYAMSNAVSRMRILSKAEKTHVDGIVAGTELGNVLGVNPNTKVTKKQIKDAKRAAGSDFAKGVEGLRNKFDTLAGALDPVIKLFDELGMKEVGQIFGAAQGALSGAAAGSAAFSALGIAGPWGAVVGGGLSLLSSGISALFGGHDEAIEEEIKASKRRQKEMENLTKNLETVLEHTLGSLYVAKADDEIKYKMREYGSMYETRKAAENNLKNGSFKFSDFFNLSSGWYIQDRTYKAIKEAEKSQSYYDAQKAALMIQQDELRSQISSEEDKKDVDWDKVQDMQQQIKDLEMQIRYFAEEMAKDLYGIDYKSWAAGLADALTDAWATGENAVDAYKKKVSEMIKEVGTKVIAQKYLEPLLQKNMDEFMKYFEANDGRMDERGFEILAKMYDDADQAARITSAFLDGVEQIANRHGDTIRDDSGSSASSSIKNITESTADLLASYINAIRADVSVNKATLMQLLTVVQGQSEMPIIARAQLVQLEQIARNTSKNANFAEDIYNLLHSLAPDGQGIKIK